MNRKVKAALEGNYIAPDPMDDLPTIMKQIHDICTGEYVDPMRIPWAERKQLRKLFAACSKLLRELET